jgi:hypothetical protein
VSTQLQGLDGFGIAAQRDAVVRFSQAFGCTIVAEYAEVETGAKIIFGIDRNSSAPWRTQAVRKLCSSLLASIGSHGALVTSQLLESGVEFVACDNPMQIV